MKKSILFCLFLALTTSQACFAVLSPYYQSIVEINEILSNKNLGEALGTGSAIEEIKKKERGYLISTSTDTVFAEIDYLPRNNPGPVRFNLKFHKVTPNGTVE